MRPSARWAQCRTAPPSNTPWAAEKRGRVSRTGRAWRVRRHGEALQDEADDRRLRDVAEDAQAPATLGAREHVDLERALQQACPVDADGGCKQSSDKQPLPVRHR
jgi:hypothetical protein